MHSLNVKGQLISIKPKPLSAFSISAFVFAPPCLWNQGKALSVQSVQSVVHSSHPALESSQRRFQLSAFQRFSF
jgi:hypothetical protein